MSLAVGCASCYRVIFGVIVESVEYYSAGCGFALSVVYDYRIVDDRSVVGCDIYNSADVVATEDLFRAVVSARDLCAHHHAPGCRSIEPAEVKDSFGLAGSEKIPLSVGPCLDPGVIVVGVGPARRIYLTRRDADTAECRNGECRLFAATAESVADCGERRRCAAVGGLISHFLVAPVVDLENGVSHRQTSDTVFEFVVKSRARHVEVFIIYPYRKYEVTPFTVWHSLPPWHLFCSP